MGQYGLGQRNERGKRLLEYAFKKSFEKDPAEDGLGSHQTKMLKTKSTTS